MTAPPLPDDAGYFLDLQTRTGWGRTLERFAAWCRPQPGWWTMDVGCGPGLLPALFARRSCRALGVELDSNMLQPSPLHTGITLADGRRLPFPARTFHLVTAVNLLFLLPDPEAVLAEMARVVLPDGQVVVLNPSERMTVAAARELASQRGLEGLARATLLNWAGRAERHARWGETDLRRLFANAGLTLAKTDLQVGPGLARLARATPEPRWHPYR